MAERSLEVIAQLNYKNTIFLISEFLINKENYKTITLIEFQKRVGSKINILNDTPAREQEQTMRHITKNTA